MKRIFFLLIFYLIFIFSGESQPCRNLPIKFNSYNHAITSIQNSSFIFRDELPYGKSSWIRNANYYSCDGVYGYLVYTTNKGSRYIHEKVPLKVWKEFKTAGSSGSYYVNKIKGRYRLVTE